MRVLLLLLIAGLAYGQHIDEGKLEKALETKCRDNSENENAFVEFKQAFNDFNECAVSKFAKEPPNPVEDHEGFCNYLRSSGFYGCAEDWTRGVIPCLNDSEKYLQHLILHAVNSTYNELCGPNGVANSKSGLAYGQHIDERKLGQLLETKCNDNSANKNAFAEFKQSFFDFPDCAQSIFRTEPPNPVEDHEGFCNYLRSSGFYGCVQDWMRGVVPCLDDSEKYLQHLFLHAVNSTYDELCGPHGVANSKLIFNHMTARGDCSGLSDIAWSEWACLSELGMMKNFENGVIDFNKHDVCLDLDKLQSCMKSVMERICPNNDQYSEILDLTLTPFTDECNDLVHD